MLENMVLSQTTNEIASNIARIGKHLMELHTKMLEAEAQFESAKKEYEHYANVIVPQEMFSAGIESMALANGGSIKLKRTYYCQPNKNLEDKAKIAEWLRQNGGEHIIKSKLSVSPEDKDTLENSGISYIENTEVNTTSLKAFLKDGLGISSGVQKFTMEVIPKCIHFSEVTTAEIDM